MWPLKIVIGVWAGLNALDDAAALIRIVRLGIISLPFIKTDDSMCELCDGVVAGVVVKGAAGIDSLPCSWLCLRVPGCVRMCETVQQLSANSSRFPCEAAGYCAVVDEEISLTAGCSAAPLFRCEPPRLCAHRWSGFKFTCQLKPGRARWIGMRDGVRKHAGAIASALYEQPRCGESGAGPWCIASPRGMGAVAEALGRIVSLGGAGLATVRALETPGGDDDSKLYLL